MRYTKTGVVSDVLLRKLRYSDEVIIEDHMKLKDNLLGMLTVYVKEHPEVDIEIIIPNNRKEKIHAVRSALSVRL